MVLGITSYNLLSQTKKLDPLVSGRNYTWNKQMLKTIKAKALGMWIAKPFKATMCILKPRSWIAYSRNIPMATQNHKKSFFSILQKMVLVD